MAAFFQSSTKVSFMFMRGVSGVLLFLLTLATDMTFSFACLMDRLVESWDAADMPRRHEPPVPMAVPPAEISGARRACALGGRGGVPKASKAVPKRAPCAHSEGLGLQTYCARVLIAREAHPAAARTGWAASSRA